MPFKSGNMSLPGLFEIYTRRRRDATRDDPNTERKDG